MNQAIVNHDAAVTLVGGGTAGLADVKEALALAPVCVAADGGLALVRAAGVDPVAVIGDFDSIDAADLASIPETRRHHVAEQDSTDFDKALRNISAPVVLAVGFTGGRIDHQLAAFHVLAARPGAPCILLGETEIVFLCPPRIDLPTRAGDVVSLFPMAAVGGTSTGLRWAIDGLEFAPWARIGTSNAATGPMRLTMDAPAMLVILPRRLLAQVTRALVQAANWPPAPR